MKRFLLFLACAVMTSALACAEALPGTTTEPVVFAPDTVAAVSEGAPKLDFDLLTPDNPAATPVAVDPIDKPTPTPAPTPKFVYETYSNPTMGVSFSIPYTWHLNLRFWQTPKRLIGSDFLGKSKPKNLGSGFGLFQKWKSGLLPKYGT